MLHFSLPRFGQNARLQQRKHHPQTVPLLLAYFPGVFIVARQQLSKHVPTATDTHETVELFDVSFYLQCVLY
jgi:hypothetical protein